MKAHTASLINALVLIVFSLWAYFASATPSVTALIPAGFGLALLACYKGVEAENKMIAHIAVLLTLVVLIALFMPLRGAVSRGDGIAIFRVAVMGGATAFAFLAFIQSFIEARKKREAAAE